MLAMPTLSDRPFTSRAAWTGSNLAADAGVLRLSRDSRDEIARLARMLEDNPLPPLSLDPDDFELPACRTVMAKAREALCDGPGFTIIDRLPMDAVRRETAIKIYWLLSCMVARPVAQKWTGEMIYTVADLTGKKPETASGPTSRTQSRTSTTTTRTTSVRPITLVCSVFRPQNPAASAGW